MIDVDVVVVGGGISGLSAARELHRAGLTVRLFERENRCGGVVRTDVVDGFVIDPGPDTLLGHKPAALALCRDLDLGDALVSPLMPRTTYVVRDGRLRALPETSAMGLPTEWKTLVTTRAFSWLGKARMAAEPFIPASTSSDESITSFVGRRFGREAVAYLAEPLLAGLHRGDAARLSVRALFPMLADAERVHGSVVRSWRKGPRTSGGRAGSMSLRGGLGQLVERLRASLPAEVVASGAEVCGVERSGAFATRLADERVLRSRAVFLAIPAPAAGAVAARVDAELARLASSIRYAPSISVALGYRRGSVRHPLHGWGVVVPVRARRHLASVTWVTSKWPDRAPPDHVLIRASLHRLRTDAAMRSSDDQVRRWVQEDLRDLIGVDDEPVVAKVYRWPAAMPQLEVGHLDRMAAIDQRLSQLPGLFISAAGFRGVGLPDCINDAQATARRAIDYLGQKYSAERGEVCLS